MLIRTCRHQVLKVVMCFFLFFWLGTLYGEASSADGEQEQSA